jgi:PIN domain nuclease of toxin-antitoxin system
MIVIDTSAILAFLFKEPGADVVAPALPMGLLSAVDYAEVLCRFERDKLGSAISIALSLPKALREVVPFDSKQAENAATIMMQTKQFGLSLGDRCCLALAMERKCAVLTADRIWLQLKLPAPVEIKSIR